jgi:predicted enzyme related to lactoylglutathione lyase
VNMDKVYAVISTRRLEQAKDWYARLFGRGPDLHPMGEVYEWYVGDGGVQLVDDAKRAGQSMLTVIVSDLEASRAALQSRQLSLGRSSGGDFARIAQISDVDGNQVTLAQPRAVAADISTKPADGNDTERRRPHRG